MRSGTGSESDKEHANREDLNGAGESNLFQTVKERSKPAVTEMRRQGWPRVG